MTRLAATDLAYEARRSGNPLERADGWRTLLDRIAAYTNLDPYTACTTCGAAKRTSDTGFPVSTCGCAWRGTDPIEARDRAIRERGLAYLATLGPQYQDAQLATAGRASGVAEARALLERSRGRAVIPARQRPWLYLSGPNGVGKTHMAIATLRAFAEDGWPIRYQPVSAWLDAVRQDQDNPERHDHTNWIIDRGARCLDDLDKVRPTPWALETLAALIDRAYRCPYPTIITANASIDDLYEYWGRTARPGEGGTVANYAAAICSRIHELAEQVAMTGPDRRREREAVATP